MPLVIIDDEVSVWCALKVCVDRLIKHLSCLRTKERMLPLSYNGCKYLLHGWPDAKPHTKPTYMILIYVG